MQFSSNDVVVFDLDDTLYKEIDFLKSAYKEISGTFGLDVSAEMFEVYRRGGNAFKYIIERYNLKTDISSLLTQYRQHTPAIELDKDARDFLDLLREYGVTIGIISDGRSVTQRNKIKALGLEWIENVIISEEFGSAKPSIANYQWFEQKFPNKNLTYIGDNVSKDFIAPNSLGWNTICLKDDGRNVHKQDFTFPKEYMPKVVIDGFRDLLCF